MRHGQPIPVRTVLVYFGLYEQGGNIVSTLKSRLQQLHCSVFLFKLHQIELITYKDLFAIFGIVLILN